MRRKLRKIVLGVAILAASAGFVAVAAAAWPMHPHFYSGAPAWVRDLKTPDYAPQKVLYHLSEGAGLRDGRYRHLLQVAGNHVAAVGKERLDLRVIMQSEGVDLLERARHNSELRGKIDKLRADGVRFLICRNTLISRGIDPDRDLYGVKREDIIRAGVGEIASLQAQGFVYMKP
jgi:intracellular sulfur oxidation DsrE/DsrF family protein